MAKIVLGLGISHTPLFTLDGNEWQHRADADFANPKLNLSDGRFLTYPELLSEVGPRHAEVARPEQLQRKAVKCEAALDRMADALAAAAPDVVVIIGDDQGELFQADNRPAIAISYADEQITSDAYGREDLPAWRRKMGRGYLMDAKHTVPGARDFAVALIEGLVDRGIDIATVGHGARDTGKGLGHAFGFVVKRIFRERAIPVVPVLLNTYYPPNVPSSARCYDMGVALSEAIRADTSDLRVAVVASGGLSHFVVDEELDLRVMESIAKRDAQTLRSLPRCALNSGSSEILNWVMAAGALASLEVASSEYLPLHRTPAGTGVGAGFLVWRA